MCGAHLVEVHLTPLATLSIALGSVGLFLILKMDHGRGRNSLKNLMGEAEALNNHSMISLSNAEAGIFHANENLLKATGYSREETIGRPSSMFYFDEDHALFDEIRAGLDAGRPWSGEMRLRCKNGEAISTLATIIPHLDRKGALVGAISIRTDITATRAASEQKELFTLLNGLQDEVYMADARTLAYTYMNRAALKRTGWNEAELHGKHLWDEDPEMDVEAFRAQMAPLLSGEVEQIGSRRRVNDTPYDVRMNLIRGADGSRRIVIVMRDNSEQERNERAKSELLSTISHELRTPMTSIKGAMGLLLSNAAGDMSDKARSMLSIAHRNADRLVNIVNDILDVEKIAAGQMEFNLKRAPLVNVLDEAIVANEPFASRFDVCVEKKNFDPEFVAEYDFERTLQVMTNLLSNAAKFSPPGGRIVISMEQVDGFTRINVRDFGKGIPADVQPRIFQRFVQAPGQTRGVNGTGLGLYICQLIMKQQNGDIGFDSTEGEGTVFHVDFPMLAADRKPLSLVTG
ncbi:PAS domain-containing sensor histidine kinase [Seohaeicola zhoushanensis]|nr:PAS domain-containing sensor histidine kinase [Seohaeicola zhoushanensis]